MTDPTEHLRGQPYRWRGSGRVDCRAMVRAVTAVLRGAPQTVVGGYIRPGAPAPTGTPYVVSPGYALVPARSIGADHDGPVIVWSDGTWEPADRDDLPAGMSHIDYDRVARQ